MEISKRKRFVITSALLSLGFISVQFLDNQFRLLAISGLGALSLVLFAWSLWEGLGLDMTALTLILPVFFTLGVGIFWFLLPVNLFTRIPVVIFYGIGVYVLALTMNIYTVSALRTIALLRAARGVGFVLTLITSFLVFDAILSLRLSILITGGLVALLSFPLYFQGAWAILLEKKFSLDIFKISLLLSLLIGEIALVLYFWPVGVVVGSLFLTVSVYMILGLCQAHLEERLFKETVRDYLMVGVLVSIGMFFATHWG